jgi:NTE family protein
MTSSDRYLSRGLVIGCGGTLGAAWTVAVLVGTSAGAELVTMLGGGAGVDELLAMHLGGATHPALDGHLAVMGPNFMDGRRRLATLEHSLVSTRAQFANGVHA